MESKWRLNAALLGAEWPGITMLAEIRSYPEPLPVPSWLANFRVQVFDFWVAEVLAFANPDYPPLLVESIIVPGPPVNFPYGLDVEPDHPV